MSNWILKITKYEPVCRKFQKCNINILVNYKIIQTSNFEFLFYYGESKLSLLQTWMKLIGLPTIMTPDREVRFLFGINHKRMITINRKRSIIGKFI